MDENTGKNKDLYRDVISGLNMGINMGPPRPPSIQVDSIYMAKLKEAMIDWGWPVPNR